MNSFKHYLESKDLSKSTIKHYYMHALDFISWLDKDNTEPENASAKEITAYLNHLKNKGQSNFTRSIHLNVIKHFFDYQLQHEQRIDNPAKHLKIRGSKHKILYPILNPQELEKLYINYELPNENDPRLNRNWYQKYLLSHKRNKAIISLMVYQGLTTPEISRINMKDLKLREGKIYISGSRKSNERELELKPNQIMELMEYQFTTRNELLNYQSEETERLFLSLPTAGKIEATNNETLQIWKGLSREIKKASPRFINFKQVRASVITHWLGKYNLRQVQYMAGHRYISSTESYLVNQVEDLQNDIEKFHPLADGASA